MPKSEDPYVLTLTRWWSERGITGERWTLTFAGRVVRTFGSELEARRFARELGWWCVRE